jgi:hypothetical protein
VVENIFGFFFASFFGFIIFVFSLALYFLPSIIAIAGHRRNAAAIFLLNLLLGWTFVGWVVALVWSVKK